VSKSRVEFHRRMISVIEHRDRPNRQQEIQVPRSILSALL
jgi:hypothetical protein